MVIKIVDYITHCHANSDGDTIFSIIKPMLDKGEKIKISFKNINSVTSSFVNSAFIELLEYFKFDYIKANLNLTNSNSNINRIIKNRFEFETKHRHNLTLNIAT